MHVHICANLAHIMFGRSAVGFLWRRRRFFDTLAFALAFAVFALAFLAFCFLLLGNDSCLRSLLRFLLQATLLLCRKQIHQTLSDCQSFHFLNSFKSSPAPHARPFPCLLSPVLLPYQLPFSPVPRPSYLRTRLNNIE